MSSLTFIDQPDWLPSYARIKRAAGDSQARKAFLRALEKYDRRQALRAKLNQPFHAEKSYEELKGDGVVVDEVLAFEACTEFRESRREQMQEETYKPIVAMLDADVNPEVRRLCLKIAAQFQADLDALAKVEDEIADRLGSARIRSTLHVGLEAAVRHWKNEAEKGADCVRHYQPRVLLSQWFDESELL